MEFIFPHLSQSYDTYKLLKLFVYKCKYLLRLFNSLNATSRPRVVDIEHPPTLLSRDCDL